MNLKEVLDRTNQFFRDKKLDSPRLDAELLIAKALNYRRIDLYLKFDQPMSEEDMVKCREFVRRRSLGEPVAYILGEKDFFGLTFTVDSRVLIPRPETELLAEAAILAFKNRVDDDDFRILDLGCGSGCLGLTLAQKFPKARVTLVDLSDAALQVATLNAEKFGVAWRCDFLKAPAQSVDLPQQSFDLIVANPPYIAHGDPRVQPGVQKFEPALALFADQDGFALIQSWAQHGLSLLKPGGWMGFEFGIDQALRAKQLFTDLGLSPIKIIPDLAGLARHVTGVKGTTNG